MKPIYGMIEASLLFTIQNDKIFGMVLCDVKTPQHLKPYFTEFCPFFKNIKLGRENFGNFVDKFAEQKWKFLYPVNQDNHENNKIKNARNETTLSTKN